MIGLLLKAGAFALPLVGRVFGIHLFTNHLAGLGEGTLQAIIEGLGWRFFAGAASTLWFTHSGFRDGIDAAIGSLL